MPGAGGIPRIPATGRGAPGSAVEGKRVTGFVLGYVVAVPAVLAILIALLEHGW